MSLPYLKNSTNHIGRLVNRLIIKTYSKPTQQNRNILCSATGPQKIFSQSGVHIIPCLYDWVYVESTKRSGRNHNLGKSSIARHAFKEDHLSDIIKVGDKIVLLIVSNHYLRQYHRNLQLCEELLRERWVEPRPPKTIASFPVAELVAIESPRRNIGPRFNLHWRSLP